MKRLILCLISILMVLNLLGGVLSAEETSSPNPPLAEESVTPQPEKAITATEVQKHADFVWTLIAAFLVFFMQAGFAMVEAGFTRAKNAVNIIMKNMMDRTRPLKMDGHRLSGKVVSALSISGLRHGGAEQVAESMIRFGLAHGMIVVGGCGDPLTTGYFGIATLQGDEGWRRAEDDAIAVTNARGVGRRVAEVALALR